MEDLTTAKDDLLEIARLLSKYSDVGGDNYRRTYEFNSVFFWLMGVVQNGLTDTVDNFYNEVKGVLK